MTETQTIEMLKEALKVSMQNTERMKELVKIALRDKYHIDDCSYWVGGYCDCALGHDADIDYDRLRAVPEPETWEN